MRTEESKLQRGEGILRLELMEALLGRGKGCYRKGKGTSDRPSAGQVSFSHGDWDGLYFPKMNATISATHMLFCKLILALSHPLEPRRALGGCDKSNVVEMAPGQFGFLPLACGLSGRSLWEISFPAVRSSSHLERPNVGAPVGWTAPLSSQLMANHQVPATETSCVRCAAQMSLQITSTPTPSDLNHMRDSKRETMQLSLVNPQNSER